MADQDPYAATAVKAPAATAAGGDPYAATAVQPVVAPSGGDDSAGPGPTGVLRAPTERERFLNPDFYPVGLKGEGVGENLKNVAQRAGVGMFQLANAAMTPRQTVASILSSLLPEPAVRAANRVVDLENKIPGAHYLTTKLPEGVPNPVAQAYQALAPGGWQAAGNVAPIAGQALAGEILPMVAPEIAAGARGSVESVGRIMTDTGKGPVERLVKDTRAENAKIADVNADRIARQQQDQVKADADHRADLLKLRQKYEQDARAATEKARTGTAADRAEYESKQLAAKQKYEQSVRDATEKHAIDRASAQQANAEALRQHNQKVGQVIQQRRAVAATEQARTQAAAQTQVTGSQLIYRLNQLDRSLRDRAGVMYDAIREKVGNATTPGSSLSTAAQDAMSKISGTSETPKIFRDILGKYPTEDPNFIEYQGAKIARGTPLYDVLAKHGAVSSPPVTFADLQGYYSELGAELSKGTLPGDVYQAARALQDSVGGLMQQLADGAGVGKQLSAARKFYRDYMDAFHEPSGPSASGSPIAQALLAKDPSIAVQKFAGASGDRGIAILRRYDPALADLAQHAQTVKRGTPTGAVPTRKSISTIPPAKVTPVPTGPSLPLPPVLESAPVARASNLPLPPVLPEPETVPVDLKPMRTISAGDITAAKQAAAEASAGKWWRRGNWAAAVPIFQAMRAFWGGHIPSIPLMGLESAGVLATTKFANELLRYPPMIRFLTQARPEDVALIPPDLRGDLPGLVSQARRQGIRVAPALIAATAGSDGQTSPVLPMPPIPPAQAIQATQPVAAGGAQ